MNQLNLDYLLDNDQLTFEQELKIRKLIKHKIYRLEKTYIFLFTIDNKFNNDTDMSISGESIKELKSKKKDIIYQIIGRNLPFIKGSTLITNQIMNLIREDPLIKSAGGYSAKRSKATMPTSEEMKINTLFEILMIILNIKQQVEAIKLSQSS